MTSSLNVREALSHAIDRQALINTVVGWADTSIVPAASHLYSQTQNGYPGPRSPSIQVSGAPGYTPPPTSATPTPAAPFPLTADPTATDRELTAAGYVANLAGEWIGPDGRPLVLRLAIDTADSWAVRSGANIVHQLTQAGITVTEVSAPNAQTAGRDLATGIVDAALLPFEATPYPSEAIAWYTTLLGTAGQGGSLDWSNFDDPTLDTTLTQAVEQLNPVDAAPLYTQADTILWTQMVALPLFSEPTVLAWSTFTSGVGPNPYGAGLLWAPETWGVRVPATSPDTVPS